MNYCGIIKNDIENGGGIGLTLFLSGCTHHCPGCHSPETWNFQYGEKFTEEIIQEIEEYFKKYSFANKLTLIGGDPFCQSIEGTYLLVNLIDRVKQIRPEIKVWCWTGYTLEEVLELNVRHQSLLASIDYLIDGPFIKELKDFTLPYRGSTNQKIYKRLDYTFIPDDKGIILGFEEKSSYVFVEMSQEYVAKNYRDS